MPTNAKKIRIGGVSHDIEDTQARADISALKSSIEQLDANMITDSAGPAPIVSIKDGADGIPLRSLSVAIEPAQDLHGYDHPWPGGVGKNKLAYPYFDTTKSLNGITFTDLGDGTINVNGTASANTDFIVANAERFSLPSSAEIVINGGYSDNVFFRCTIDGNTPTSRGGDVSLTTTNGEITGNCYIRVVSGTTVNNVVIKPMIRLASVTDPTFEPYSNICPITGWTGATVTRTGKNLLDMSRPDGVTASASYVVNYDGSITVTTTGNQSSVQYILTGKLPAGTYTAKNYSTQKESYVQISSQSDYSRQMSPNGGSRTFEYDGTSYLRFFYGNQPTQSTMTYKAQIELGSTATAYEPYQGETYDITFPTEAGTVYGGTLDVTSGKLVVDRKMIDFDKTANWVKSSATACDTYVMDGIGSIMSQFDLSKGGESNVAVISSANVNDSIGVILIKPTQVRFGFATYGTTTVQDFKNWLDDKAVQLNLYLATPIEYTLTQQEITTLLGANNIWTDAGDTSIAYRADTKMYIDNKITQAIAAALNA